MHGGDIYRNDIELDFSVNVNPFGAPDTVKRALKDAIEKIENYPDTKCQKLGEALAEKTGIDKEDIVFGNGASELFNAITLSIRPKRTLIPEPAFSGYGRAAAAAGSEIVSYRLSAHNDYRLDEGILSEMTDDIDMLFLANPNNPNGKGIDRDLLGKILDRSLEKGIITVLDECFITLAGKAETESFIKRTCEFPNLCIVRSFTKTYAIPGVRLGYMVASNEKLKDKVRLTLGEWNVSLLAQEAGLEALAADDYLRSSIEFIGKERKWLIEEVRKIGYNVIESEADFIMFWAEKGLDRKLIGKKILIRNCSDYTGLDDECYRIAVKKHEENLRLINAIRDVKGS